MGLACIISRRIPLTRSLPWGQERQEKAGECCCWQGPAFKQQLQSVRSEYRSLVSNKLPLETCICGSLIHSLI